MTDPTPRPRTFTARDTFTLWREQGHNERTRNAWETGVKRGGLGEAFGVYSEGDADYWKAEIAGYREARRRVNAGERWQCDCCGAHHGAGVFDVRKH